MGLHGELVREKLEPADILALPQMARCSFAIAIRATVSPIT
jgi:hypothetical protein